MTTQVALKAGDVEALVSLQTESSGCTYQITTTALEMYEQLPKELHITIGPSKGELSDDYSSCAVEASQLATMMMSASCKGLWTDVLPFLDAVVTTSRTETSPTKGAARAWLDACATYIHNHRREPLFQPSAKPEDFGAEYDEEIAAEKEGAVVRLVAPVTTRPFMPALTMTVSNQSHPERMTAAELDAYYSGAGEYDDESREGQCTKAQVESIWNHIYNGLGVSTFDEQRELRTHVLVYTMNNGCSPNTNSTRTFEVSNTRSVAMLEVFKYIADEAGTLRRFMRGMADEAVAYIKSHPKFVPFWGRKNMGSDFERTIGFDYADGRSDLDAVDLAKLRNVLDDALDRQASSNRRAEYMTPNEGPLRGSVHDRTRAFQRRESRDSSVYRHIL